MPVSPASGVNGTNEGLFRFSGMYGEARRDGAFLADVMSVAGAIEIAQVAVPLAGQERLGYKPGRQTRTGTMRIQKIDSRWEQEVYRFTSMSLAARRAARDKGEAIVAPFNLVLKYDDPYALGTESIQLNGVLMWRLNIGFDATADIVDREIPITWESERYLTAFKVGKDSRGNPKPVYYDGMGPKS